MTMQHPVDPAGEYSPIPGEMSRLIAGKDWSLTTLGPPANWPVSLRTAVNIALASQYPTVIFWGPELRMPLLENSPLAVIEWTSADYRIVRWSDEATKVFGWTAEETVGRRIDELNWVYAEDWPLVEQVLIIEDNKDAADSLSEALGLSGHRVAVAYDGTAGLAMAREFRPEVIICDIGLPGDMDGYAVARALRRDAGTASTLLIALTGYAQPEDQRQALAAGFDANLAKPPSLEKILGMLEVGS
jgi:CheY-like chemotaxis protein